MWVYSLHFMGEKSEAQEGKQCAQSHTAVRWRRWNLHTGVSPASVALAMMLFCLCNTPGGLSVSTGVKCQHMPSPGRCQQDVTCSEPGSPPASLVGGHRRLHQALWLAHAGATLRRGLTSSLTLSRCPQCCPCTGPGAEETWLLWKSMESGAEDKGGSGC